MEKEKDKTPSTKMRTVIDVDDQSSVISLIEPHGQKETLPPKEEGTCRLFEV